MHCNSGIGVSNASVLPLFSCFKTGKIADILTRNLTILYRFQDPAAKKLKQKIGIVSEKGWKSGKFKFRILRLILWLN